MVIQIGALLLKPHKSLGCKTPGLDLGVFQNELLTEFFGAKFHGMYLESKSYDFRPKKGSYLIDSGVVIPGVNNGEDVDNSIVKAKPGGGNLDWY